MIKRENTQTYAILMFVISYFRKKLVVKHEIDARRASPVFVFLVRISTDFAADATGKIILLFMTIFRLFLPFNWTFEDSV